MKKPLARHLTWIGILWISTVVIWSISKTISLYEEKYRKQRDAIYEDHRFQNWGLNKWGVHSWASQASAMADPGWCESVAKKIEIKAKEDEEARERQRQAWDAEKRRKEEEKQALDTDVELAKWRLEQVQAPSYGAEWSLHLQYCKQYEQAQKDLEKAEHKRREYERRVVFDSLIPDDSAWLAYSDIPSYDELVSLLRNPEQRKAKRQEAEEKLAIIQGELRQASWRTFMGFYLYWLIIPVCLGLIPGLGLIGLNSRWAWSCMEQYGPLRCAIFVSVTVFVLLIVFATPKTYKLYAGGGQATVSVILPFFYAGPDYGGSAFVSFAGINLSVLLAELLGSIAIGCMIWVFGGGRGLPSNSSFGEKKIGPLLCLPQQSFPSPSREDTAEHGPVADDEPVEQQESEFNRSPLMKMGLICPLPGCEEIEGASGPFGECPSNPIPVNGQIGEVTYLSRLRSKSGVGFMWHRIGTEETSVYPHPIDVYEMVAIDASEWQKLYFAMYHRHRTRKVPSGLSLLAWSRMKDIEQIMSKTGFPGHIQKVDNFPFGLPAVVVENPMLNQIAPNLGRTMAKAAQKWIDEHRGKWAATYRQFVG